MKTFVMQICVGFLLATASSVALAQAPTGDAIPVTADNFIRAETDRTFAVIERQGGFSKFMHFRELSPIDNHTIKRANRDTLYSVGVFDLDAGPVTISLPDAGSRFMTMIVIDEDHYVFTVVRILVDPNDPKNDVTGAFVDRSQAMLIAARSSKLRAFCSLAMAMAVRNASSAGAVFAGSCFSAP